MELPSGSWNRASGSIWNARQRSWNFGTPSGHLEQSLRLYLERPWALGTVLPLRGVRGVLERALAHNRLPDAIHDIAHVIVRHIRTCRQAEADLEDGF